MYLVITIGTVGLEILVICDCYREQKKNENEVDSHFEVPT